MSPVERAATRRFLRWVDGPGLIWLFVVGLVVRLVLARGGGLPFDVETFRGWSDRLVDVGPRQFYAPGYFADYPPGYLYVLFGLGKLARFLDLDTPSTFLLKLPAIGADLVVAFVAVQLASRLAPTGSNRFPARAAAAAAILFNPVVILTSATWGQVDSFLAAFALGAVYLVTVKPPSRRRDLAAVTLLALGIVTKPQTVFAVPVIAVVLVHRRKRAARDLAWMGALGAMGALVIVLAFAPFGIGPTEVPGFYRDAGSVYEFTSLWAFNLWGVVGFYRPDVGDGAVSVLGIDAFTLGTALFVVGTAIVMVRAWRALDHGTPAMTVGVFGVTAVTCIGFALLTRSHERYAYLAVVALAPLLHHRQFRWGLLVLSVLLVADLHFVYVYFVDRSAGDAWTIGWLYDLVFGTVTDAAQRKALSAVTAAVCLFIAWRGWRWIDGRHEGRQPDAAPDATPSTVP